MKRSIGRGSEASKRRKRDLESKVEVGPQSMVVLDRQIQPGVEGLQVIKLESINANDYEDAADGINR